jgi:hypothetical protein
MCRLPDLRLVAPIVTFARSFVSSYNSGLAMAESERVGELRSFIFPSPADVISSTYQS